MARRQQVFSVETKLWHPSEGWRVFPAGETDPGNAWSETEGGHPVGAASAAGALKDLIEANDQLDQMRQMMAAKDHDLAVMAKERDAANAKVSDLEQAGIDAVKARAAAEDAARGYMAERDTARAEMATANAKITDLEAQVEALTAPAKPKSGKPASEG